MGLTAVEKLLSAHTDSGQARQGEWITARVDLTMATDVSAALCIQSFDRIGASEIFDRNRVILVNDHFVPAKDIASADLCKAMRAFAMKFQIPNYFEVGRSGISHSLMPEQGLVLPGDFLVGADSHTCTAGAVGAFATGMGATSVAAAWALGEMWLKVPDTIQVLFHGNLPEWVVGKDLILKVIQDLGMDGGSYTALEFSGNGMSSLQMSDRFTLCNMALEAGCKTAIVPPDAITERYVQTRAKRKYQIFQSDPDAVYQRTLEYDLSRFDPLVACPFSPDNVRPANELARERIKVDQVFIGSCTNGSIDDLRMAHKVMKGRQVHSNVRLIVIPATQLVYLTALREGILEDLAEAGASISSSTCGPCLGGHLGVLGDAEVAVSTTSRNFSGRMGAKSSRTYLANPAVAAASAILGRVADPREIH
jgi:3-isopropylmalate/(R)-2-methylmalate dehydratase large subunit